MSFIPSFGDLIIQKRMEQGLTLRGLAEKLEISAPYLCDMEKNRRQPTEKPLLDKLADFLCMTESERNQMYDLAGEYRGEVSSDLPDYIMKNEVVRVALRKAKAKNISEEEWLRFIQSMDCSES